MLKDAINQLRWSGNAIEALVRDLDDAAARWKPSEKEWSVVEVLAHLVDEERDDFRSRLDLTLRHPEREWPQIDPESTAVERGYASKDLTSVLEELRREREASLVWLRSLAEPDWNQAHEHLQFGAITAGTLLASWVAHDLLHLRQIAAVLYHRFATVATPHSVDYAGPAPK